MLGQGICDGYAWISLCRAESRPLGRRAFVRPSRGLAKFLLQDIVRKFCGTAEIKCFASKRRSPRHGLTNALCCYLMSRSSGCWERRSTPVSVTRTECPVHIARPVSLSISIMCMKKTCPACMISGLPS